MAKRKKVLVATPRGIAAFAWLAKPDTGHQFSNGKFKVTLVLPGETDLSGLEAKARAAFAAEKPDAPQDDLRFPWKSGDDHKHDEFHGKTLLNATSKFKPMLIDSKKVELRKGIDVRSGDEVKLVVDLFPYESTEKVREGKKTVTVTTYGVSAQLSKVQLLRKNAGGGGLELLDEEDDGFDQDDYEGPSNSGAEDDEEEDNGNADY